MIRAASLPVARHHTETIDVQAGATVHADTATAWRVLTDYERYPEFIPDLQRSRVVARSGSRVTVEQSGLVVLWLLKMPVEVTFEIWTPASNRSKIPPILAAPASACGSPSAPQYPQAAQTPPEVLA